MIRQKNSLALFYFLIALSLANVSSAEPLIVLEYSSETQFSAGDGKNPFSMNPLYSDTYTVKTGDSLNSILQKFYKGSGLDWRFVQLSIVIANPKAFAKNNPNFLFSDVKVYLPGKSDISKLLLGKKVGTRHLDEDDTNTTKNIYFFGG
jgi:hypothetical protein